MKYLLLIFAISVCNIASEVVPPNHASLDARYYKRINDRLHETSEYLCNVKCGSNPEGCSKEAWGCQMCPEMIYRVFHSNYKTCMYRCKNAGCNSECSLYVDCENSCLKIVEDKVIQSEKTPDELIRAWADNERAGVILVYVS